MQTTSKHLLQTSRILGFMILIMMSALKADEVKQKHSSEQVNFSAEDENVKRPVAIPSDVLDMLKKDQLVQSIMEENNVSPENLPSSWFSASAIHLSSPKKKDLIVVGQPPVVGGNVTVFWIFAATDRGYELVLNAPAHSLGVKNSRWKGYREIELTSSSAVQFSRVLCRFDGKKYRKYKVISKKLR